METKERNIKNENESRYDHISLHAYIKFQKKLEKECREEIKGKVFLDLFT